MTNANPREIRLTPEFQRKLKKLSKRYRQIRSDLDSVIERLAQGERLGDQIPDIGFTVMKVRIKSSDILSVLLVDTDVVSFGQNPASCQ